MRLLECAVKNDGGKAQGLRRLLELGVPVPHGLVLDSRDVEHILSGNVSGLEELASWLSKRSGAVAVRSSAQNEDGREFSFAGMYKTKLSVPAVLDNVVAAIAEVSKSGQSARVHSYAGFTSDVIPVIIQDLVEAEAAGVMFSRARDITGEDCVYIEWVRGLGEDLVSGRVRPASVKIPRTSGGALDVESVQTNGRIPPPKYLDFWLHLLGRLPSDSEGSWDIEWAISGRGEMWALQMRPQTAAVLVPEFRALWGFLAASSGVGRGPAVCVDDSNHSLIVEGDILVAKITEADYIPAMRRASGIITEEGGLLSHAAIVARELGKPCIVGFSNALTELQPGILTEINGNIGTVRQGDFTFGQSASQHLDGRSIYLYDKGVELSVKGTPVYLEPSLDGLLAFVDQGCPRPEMLAVNAELRGEFHQAADIVEGDRRIWHREWRRFDQLRSVALAELLFKFAISSWSVSDLNRSLGCFRRLAARISELRNDSSYLEKLFWCELGAALHALVSMQVEGKAVWASFRDSAIWRAQRGVSFADLLARRQESKLRSNVTMMNMVECMKDLGTLRNDAYYLFESLNLFSNDYFPNRNILVEKACSEVQIEFEDEDTSLSMIYKADGFKALDRACFSTLAPVVIEGII